ncbi:MULTISPECIES: hypothetical protein [Paenibacillus]|uniref:Uncharacterized protein n=1 Tax=Paenibacillus campinasensis TaxID=66347 RepID=A0ABW9SYL7_9BACL|nr:MULTISPECIES: hypothetical protein [Paenibacillus]MUG66123.1 hypothetical protein [Paenibacillus campinasensis]PAK50023.1 hypothetical protein CHH75_18880 [Paenibacillus sp. 7541]
MKADNRVSPGTAIKLTMLFALICITIFAAMDHMHPHEEVITTELVVMERLADTPNTDGRYDTVGYSVMGSTTKTVTDRAGALRQLESQSVTDHYDFQGRYEGTYLERTQHTLRRQAEAVQQTATRTSPVHDPDRIEDFIASGQIIQWIDLTAEEEQALADQIQEMMNQLFPR